MLVYFEKNLVFTVVFKYWYLYHYFSRPYSILQKIFVIVLKSIINILRQSARQNKILFIR